MVVLEVSTMMGKSSYQNMIRWDFNVLSTMFSLSLFIFQSCGNVRGVFPTGEGLYPGCLGDCPSSELDMRSSLLTVCSHVMFLLNLVCVNTASIAVLGNMSNQK